MSETTIPLLHINGIITEKDYKAALRAHSKRRVLLFCVSYLLFLLLFIVGMDLYHAFPYLKDGSLTFGEWLKMLWEGINPVYWCVVIGFIILYAVYLLLIRPMQLGRRMRELDPDGEPVEYDFYDDHIELRATTQTDNRTVRMKYGDVQRKIKENKYIFILSTSRKNRLAIYKTIMTAEEVENVRNLLYEHCPQRKLK